ncbi:MAG TPA: hypothetical protein VNY05_27110 [Candidatus Acidoferrales bacterium]|jgi:hypothetical protein|nr:hypothetical protein [Candidatus Acidoferrales bacterium]
MRWIKQGLIFAPDARYEWMASHAQLPVVEAIGDERLRIYFGTRDSRNRTVPTFIEVAAAEPRNVLYVHDKPVLGLGELGCFDDSGVIPAWIVNHAGRKYLYYIGVNTGVTIPYRYSIGLAVSSDGGLIFCRAFAGPIVDRAAEEPHLCTSPCVLIENRTWKMWYAAGLKWEVLDGKPEPFYNIRYSESADGVHWRRPGLVALDLMPDEGGIGRPCVVPGPGLYRMWFSFRGPRDYRTNKANSYRIGYAESGDGIAWTRTSEAAGIDVSEVGWDSEMVAYPYVYQHRERLYMVYNGNGFGKSGFGFAVADPADPTWAASEGPTRQTRDPN